jgi:queuine/archaeosine tRNA-ribosyltransferase
MGIENGIDLFDCVLPTRLGEMEYKGKKYLGVEAYCQNRKSVRTFRVDRMVEIGEGE